MRGANAPVVHGTTLPPRGTTMNDSLIELRHTLHRIAERAGHEERTSALVEQHLRALAPDQLVTGIGGYGLVATFEGKVPGRTVLVRADMDALPLTDDPSLPYASEDPTTAHLCGHDGHTATVVGVARRAAALRPERGRLVILFQPAEETGAGANAMLTDPAFEPFRPDFAIAQHNLPGFPLGSVLVRKGPFASASRGMITCFRGRSSHAAEPHEGATPVPAVTRLAQVLATLPQHATALHETAQVTVVGLEAGGPAFGTSPASGKVMATLRAHEQDIMDRISERAKSRAEGLAHMHELQCEIEWVEEFPATVNDPGLTDLVAATAADLSMPVEWRDHAFAWSEDFGHFTSTCPGVLFGLGSGVDQPALHAPGYDFPDALLEPGSKLLFEVARRALDGSHEDHG